MAYINKKKIYFAGISKGISERYTEGIIVEDIEPEVSLISFTIDGTSYQAEEGMTWSEWVESDYNTGDFVVYGGAIYEDSNLGSILQTADNYNVDPTYTIISNHAYWLNTTGGAN